MMSQVWFVRNSQWISRSESQVGRHSGVHSAGDLVHGFRARLNNVSRDSLELADRLAEYIRELICIP